MNDSFPPPMQAGHAPLDLAPRGLGLVPMVVEQSARGERAYDIYSRLLSNGSCS